MHHKDGAILGIRVNDVGAVLFGGEGVFDLLVGRDIHRDGLIQRDGVSAFFLYGCGCDRDIAGSPQATRGGGGDGRKQGDIARGLRMIQGKGFVLLRFH